MRGVPDVNDDLHKQDRAMSGEKQPAKDPDARVAIPLDPEEALRGLLKVKPEDERKPNPPPKKSS